MQDFVLFSASCGRQAKTDQAIKHIVNTKSERFLSLDVFRGMTVCLMIIVNSPGSGATPFAPLQHAAWHGFTPTDLVFPSFLFAVGNALSLSLAKMQQLTDRQYWWKISRRAGLIFLLGFLLYWFPFIDFGENGISVRPFSHTRVMGVLQRIAICYFFVALMIRYWSVRNVAYAGAALLLGYWLILLLGGGPDPLAMTENAGYYFDRYIIGDNHLYHGEGVAFDPEGLLSTLPSMVNVIIGLLAGVTIQRHGKSFKTISFLTLGGALLIVLGLMWDPFFPINKKLWTSSFVLLTSGIDLIIIGALLYLIEIRTAANNKWTYFFTVFGKNALFIYLLSEIIVILLFAIPAAGGASQYHHINDRFFQAAVPGPWGSLIFALSVMFLCWLTGWWMDKKRIYISV